MENLKGKTFLIGREPGKGRLVIAIQGSNEVCYIGNPGSVPDSVSRCYPSDGKAHAKLMVDHQGIGVVSKISEKNIMFVNGQEVVSKRVTSSNTLQLGKDRFAVPLSQVVAVAKKIQGHIPEESGNNKATIHQTTNGPNNPPISVAPPDNKPGTFNISHLQYIWDDTQSKKKELQQKQKKVNLIRSGCGVFTMCAMPCIYFLGPVGYVLTGIGIIGNLYSFLGLKNDDTQENIEKITEDFQDRYTCPNPECGKFLGNMRYNLLKKQTSMKCPYCKCNFVEK